MRCGGRAQRGEPLDRQREVRAALGRDERVNLVDDHRVDRAQRLARVGGQEQIQRFRRRDEDVGRLALKSRAIGLRCVAGAYRDRRRHVRIAASFGQLCDAGQRRAQVALHVDRERLERRHIQHTAPADLGGCGREHHAIETPQKGCERFAAAGRRKDERGLPPGDRRPAERLRACGGFERRAEPRAHRGMKRREGIFGSACGHVPSYNVNGFILGSGG